MTMRIELYDAARERVAPTFESRITLINGALKIVRQERIVGQALEVPVEVTNGPIDNYSVHVSAAHCHDTWFHPVNIGRIGNRPVSLMMLPRKTRYRFEEWESLSGELRDFFSRDPGSEGEGRDRYNDLLDGPERQQDILGAFHNFTTALTGIRLEGRTAFSYFRKLIWNGEKPPAGDRIYAVAHRDIGDALERGRKRKEWATASTAFHPGATKSYKEKSYGEGNLQISIYGKDDVGEKDFVRVEVDIDYYRDALSHALLELVPNKLAERTTDPKMGYRLRWIAMRNISGVGFDPPYILERDEG